MKLAKTYEPNEYEPNIYALWEKSGAFKPSGRGELFSTVMPPPNANANLHIGHALDMGLKDISVRYKRMRGYDTIFIPGADHAGFETWVVYEKELNKQAKSRFDFTREQLYNQVWDFVDQQRGNMELQLRAIGVSADWEKLVFTLDSKVIKTVYATFKKLWDEGLVYRGERIVNYSTKFQTSYADIEVDQKQEKGTLWHIGYSLVEGPVNGVKEIIIATTRPETLFGDTAVAVSPEDDRYKDLIGKKVHIPLTDREVEIIADEYVDAAFGTGAVKITPAHDPNDFEVGKRHNLERLQVIDFDGTMINVPKEFIGLDVDTARQATLKALKDKGLIRKEETIEHTVGYDYKSGLPIQPLIKDQWFLKIKPLAKRALEALENNEISFYPASRQHILRQYLQNIRDWNLSRQIPWGIPIPAFQNVDDDTDWIFDESVSEETIEVAGKTYRRDEDTFDTWFSSGQWPFITTEALDGGDLSRFYPTNLMETGTDLLDRWIARMIMLGLYVTDQVPFKDVYLHGMVLDEYSQKMSKSKGNVINPMDSIATYGSDALRLGLVAGRSPGQNQAFGLDRIIAGRNFCNKLWNIARFIENKLGDEYEPDVPVAHSLADHWIISELQTAKDIIEHSLDTYRYAEASDAMYHVIWDSVADWYIEASKDQRNDALLAWVIDISLKLAHPFAPFVTETIWQTLSWHDTLLISETWPEIIEYSDISAAEFGRVQQLVTEARFVTSALPGNEKYSLLYGDDSLIADNNQLIKRLAKLDKVIGTVQPHGLRLAVSGRDAWLDVSAKTLADHQVNLEERLAATHADIQALEGRLAHPNYMEKAPEKLVAETKQLLDEKKAVVIRLQQELELLKI
ncbi:MAG: valine--tRNA ligase [Candidatus Microsaccharimonas sossegonensis]|uniref:Valine--tRNA ligase n=1 Tax=Candidatus Microsaccharimonas sossegonensis TaxID=2506948 RepID=A0A4V1J7E4_9BACT|nr:MAG: valine--tRNA ligase [Candidatus Microsaccharimonas sossegonensis]